MLHTKICWSPFYCCIKWWTCIHMHFRCSRVHKVVWHHWLGEVDDIHTFTYAIYF